jgi:hypothetical protein
MLTGMEANTQAMDASLWQLLSFLDYWIGNLHETVEMVFFVAITCFICCLAAKALGFIWRHMFHIWF